MNRARWKAIDEQFREAIDLPEAARVRFVRELQVRNPELGAAVKGLLESAAEAEAVLGESAAVFAGPMLAGLNDEEWDALHPGAIVGGYRLLREIGRSGRSTVYLAEPANTKFGTRVAIKVLSRGADADEIIGRILHEREALTALDHRGIARFIDGGATGGGLPCLILELVDGRPLLAWCDERSLDTAARLGLFLQVCAAVQHAHQHFVAHSDLSPSRILVTDQGNVKIMEFGTARLLQAGPVTTADDVRSLGVLLQQLLTGRSAKSSADLDAIVARALEPDAARCYQSAGALADDIMRHLKHRPVHARPASLGYRAGRFALRHRARLGIAALAVLAIGSVAATRGFRLSRAEDAVDPAPTRMEAAVNPSLVAPAPAAAAPAPAATATATPTTSTTTMTTERMSVAPVVKQLPDDSQRIETRGADRAADSRRSPADSVAMLDELARTLRKAGRNTEAEAALRNALSLDPQESLSGAERVWELADLLRVSHRYREAEDLMRQSLLLRKRLTSNDGAEVGQSLVGLALVQCEQGRTAESDSLFRQASAIYRSLPTDAGGLRMPETDRAQCR
jgi:serine/threonine protein kinase